MGSDQLFNHEEQGIMSNNEIKYETGEVICEYLADRQIIHLENNITTIMAMADGKYIRGSVTYKGKRPVSQSKITSRDPENKFAEGMISRFTSNGDIVDKQKYVVDYKKGIETVFRDPYGNGIAEIRKLDPVNFATIETTKYNASRNIKSIEKMQDNLRHGTCLYFYNNTTPVPEGMLSKTKENLAEIRVYDQGMSLSETCFDKIGRTFWQTTGTKRDPDDDLYRDYSYEEDGTYLIEYSNPEFKYMDEKCISGLVLARDIFDEEQKIIYAESFHYDHELYAYIDQENYCSQVVVKEKKEFYPKQWDGFGEVESGTMKHFKDNILFESGPFVSIEGLYVNEGIHLLRHGEVHVYQQGEVLDSYKRTVQEEFGELIIKQNAPHQQDEKNASPDYSPA